MTAVPASWLPCCCKFRPFEEPSIPPEHTCYPVAAKTGCCGDMAVQTCPLCSRTAAEDGDCSAGNMLKKDCPGCRCAEQMQIVALSGYTTQETSLSMGVAIAGEAPEQIPVTAASEFLLCPGDRPPGVAPFLQTCNLRC